MIRVSHQDRGGAVDLFQQHDAHELMRPGERPEGEMQGGVLGERSRKPVGATDHEGGVAPAIVPAAQAATVQLFTYGVRSRASTTCV